MVGRHRRGKGKDETRNKDQNGTEKVVARWRVEWHDERGKFHSEQHGASIVLDQLIDDLKRRKLQYFVTKIV
jgi:hypothetical protein